MENSDVQIVGYSDVMAMLGVQTTDANYGLCEESVRVDDSREQSSISNFMLTKPRGIIIEDSWNNIAFPIRPLPKIDTREFDLKYIYRRYREEYTSFNPIMLPWHYVIEYVDGKYYAFVLSV